MGTTLAGIQAGSLAYQLVAAIEGYDKLLTNGSTSAAVTAWSGTDWSSALGGLFVSGYNEQAIDPWEPFRNGGRMSLHVLDQPGSSDAFGIATARKLPNAETFLAATADRNDTTLTVVATATFASSGTLYIGTEAIAYGGKTSTTFTSCTRGKYSPFLTDGAANFGGHHRVGPDPNAVPLQPLVTDIPRIWVGKWVGIWMHRVVAGVLDVKAEAQLIFAGRIVALYDDPETGATVVELKHVLDYIKEQTLGRDLWSAKTKEGVFLEEGDRFDLNDYDGVTTRTADPLMVVASGASGNYEINEGYYTRHQLYNAINNWWAQAFDDGDTGGTYHTDEVLLDGKGLRTRILWNIPVAGGTLFVHWHFGMPVAVGRLLGFTNTMIANSGQIETGAASTTFGDLWLDSPYETLKMVLSKAVGEMFFQVTSERGVFWDNSTLLPDSFDILTQATDKLGVFLIDEKYVFVGRLENGEITHGLVPTHPFTNHLDGQTELVALSIPASSSQPAELSIRQIIVIEARFQDLIRYLVYSTGTSAFNESTYDVLPYGMGLAIPGELATGLDATVTALAGAYAPLLVILDEPTRIVDLFAADLILRRAFFRWKNGTLEVGTWKTPVSASSVATLTEATKAAPSTQRESHRCASSEQGFFKKPIIKIDYDRDILDKQREGGYRSSITIEDKTAVDDAGGDAAPFTISARNVYLQYTQTGAALEDLVSDFIALAPLFTRDFTLIRRSIDSRYFEGLGVGDIVTVSDSFARDPDTGRRIVSARPALVIRLRSQWGGRQAGGQVAPAGGEVDLFLLAQNRIAAYVPTAMVDYNAANAGYNVGTKVLTCLAHTHSESSEAADASNFPATSKVRVIEIDPADPDAPLTWDDTVASQTGNTITLTTGLGGWDNTKLYRVVFDDYTDATATQQAKCFQADDADYRIQDTRVPFDYGLSGGASPYTAASSSDLVALPPNTAAGDGVGLDTGHQRDLTTLINNLLDYKMAVSSPGLYSTEASGATVTGTYLLVEMCPIWLGAEVLGNGIERALSVAPMLKSSDGASASCRVSLCRTRPFSNTNDDVDRGAVYAEAVFTTTSTTYTTPTAQELTINGIKDIDGMAWLTLELTIKARSWGLAECQVGPRTV